MTPAFTATLSPPRPQGPLHLCAETAPQPRPTKLPSAYDRPFWLTYISNMFFSTAVALLFRYADFVTVLGGTEFHLGWIVGVGMIGSLAMRMVLGSWIDRYGARPLWLGSILLFTATCFAHLMVAGYSGMPIYLLRISYCCAVAGLGGASLTFVSARAPNDRVAELVGMLGTGGFLGNIFGTLLGDFLFGSITISFTQVAWMFTVAGLLGLLSLPFAWAATRNEKASRVLSLFSPLPLGEGPRVRAEQGSGFRIQGSETPNLQISKSPNQHSPHPLSKGEKGEKIVLSEPSPLALVIRYNPGFILAIGMAMGMGLGLPSTFLRTYAAELGIPRIGLFFLVYSITAIAIRVPTRRWTERFGPRRIILVGMAGVSASIAIFPLVHAEWQLVLPAIGFGCSHAILWPAVVAAGSVTFPRQHRGLATVLILAAWDLGLLVASPAAGVILSSSETFALPPYPTMFLSIAGLLGMVGLWYALASRNARRTSKL
jgi:MFS family permease